MTEDSEEAVNVPAASTAVASPPAMPYKATDGAEALWATCASLKLEIYDPKLPPRMEPWRRIYVSEELKRSVKEDAVKFTLSHATQAKPVQQIIAELDGFCRGDPLAVAQDFHCLEPFSHQVWELKTPDVRIFGWFVARNCFIAHCIGDANVLHKDRKNYLPFIQKTTAFRLSLTPPLPKPLQGVRASNVVSNRIRKI